MTNNQVLLPTIRNKKQQAISYRPQYITRNEDDPDEEPPSMNFLAMGIKLKTKSLIPNKNKQTIKNQDSINNNDKMPKLNNGNSNSENNIILVDSIGVSYQLENKSANLILNNNDNINKNQFKKAHFDRKSYMNVTGTNLKNMKFKQINFNKNYNTVEIGKDLKAQRVILNCNCENDLNIMNSHYEKHDCVSCKYKGKINLNLKKLAQHNSKSPSSANSSSLENNSKINNERIKTSSSKYSSQSIYPFPNLQNKSSDNKKGIGNKNAELNQPENNNNNNELSNNEEEIVPKLTLWLV
jgi:hypothetical protein